MNLETLLTEVQGMSGNALEVEARKAAFGAVFSTKTMRQLVGDARAVNGWLDDGEWVFNETFDLSYALEWLEEEHPDWGDLYCTRANPFECMWIVDLRVDRNGDTHDDFDMIVRGASPAEAVMRACVLVARMKEAR